MNTGTSFLGGPARGSPNGPAAVVREGQIWRATRSGLALERGTADGWSGPGHRSRPLLKARSPRARSRRRHARRSPAPRARQGFPVPRPREHRRFRHAGEGVHGGTAGAPCGGRAQQPPRPAGEGPRLLVRGRKLRRLHGVRHGRPVAHHREPPDGCPPGPSPRHPPPPCGEPGVGARLPPGPGARPPGPAGGAVRGGGRGIDLRRGRGAGRRWLLVRPGRGAMGRRRRAARRERLGVGGTARPGGGRHHRHRHVRHLGRHPGSRRQPHWRHGRRGLLGCRVPQCGRPARGEHPGLRPRRGQLHRDGGRPPLLPSRSSTWTRSPGSRAP